MGMVHTLFSFHGRINRLQYWLYGLLSGLVGTALAAVVIISAVGNRAYTGALLLMIPVWIGFVWVSFALQVKRLHDRGRSGYLSLIPLGLMTYIMIEVSGKMLSGAPPAEMFAAAAPARAILALVNLFFFIDLGCLPGVDGPNKYDITPGGSGSSPLFGGGSPAAPTAPMSGALSAMDRAIAERDSQPVYRKAGPPGPALSAAPRPAMATPGRAPTPGAFGRRGAR